MALIAHRAVGLANPLYLPDDIPFDVRIIPAGNTNVRSNTKRSASSVTRVTRHETANFKPGADAEMHYRYLMGNPAPAAGYNCVSDDKKIIHLTPYDEDTWAAGNYEGNHTSDHHELCVNEGINHTRARYIAACLDAAVLYARGLPVSGLVQHNYWWGKNCPYLLRTQGLWPSYVNSVTTAYNAIVAHVKGSPVPTPVVGGIEKGDTVLVLDSLNLRQGSGTSYPVIRTLAPETTATVIDGPRSADGYTWFDIKGDFGTGWVAADWLQETTPAKEPDTGWPYPKPVVPAFWDALMKDGATHAWADDTLWIRVDTLYRVKAGTKRQQYAVKDDRVVGPDMPAGTEFRAAAVGQSAMDKKAWVITPGLTRVALEDLEIVIES